METTKKPPKPRSKRIAVYYTLKSKLDAAYEIIKQLKKENKELKKENTILQNRVDREFSLGNFSHGW